MQSLQLAWGILWRMAGWGLLLGAVLGMVNGLISAFVFDVVAMLGYLDGYAGGYGQMLGSVLITFGSAGLLLGAFLGLPGGVVAGIVMAAVCRVVGAHRLFNSYRYRSLLRAVAAAIAGFTVLLLAWPLLTFLAPATQVYRWVLFVAGPPLIAAGATWRAAKRVLNWVESQHPTTPLVTGAISQE
ncbi:MAG: hypothetical protein M3Z04_12665 [Chloroflexota bacterium]|nr:hypothetical protein [Chloroflexota bacterium]